MIIMKLNDFLDYKPGSDVVFVPISGAGNFGELSVRVQVIDGDFYYISPTSELDLPPSDALLDFFDQEFSAPVQVSMDQSCASRWGFYDEDDLFAVFEKSELEGLLNCIKATLK